MHLAVTFPVASPGDGLWKEFNETMRTLWRQTTSLANWGVLELYAADYRRQSGETKIPKLTQERLNTIWSQEKGGLYQHAVRCYPDWGVWKGMTYAPSTILRQVESKWQKERYKIAWRCDGGYPVYKYPMPLPINSRNFNIRQESDGAMFFRVSLGGRKWDLRLRGGRDFKRQIGTFRKMLSGEYGIAAAQIYRKTRSSNIERGGQVDRKNGGGSTKHYDVIVKLVYKVETPTIKEGRTLMVRTDPNAIWVVELEGRQPWLLNADYIRRIIAAHAVYRQRMSEDLKYEKRWPKRMRTQMLDALAKRCNKNNRRLDAFCHEASAMLIGFAKRNGVENILYDDSNKEYISLFPWSKLKNHLFYKAEKEGMKLIAVKDEEETTQEEG